MSLTSKDVFGYVSASSDGVSIRVEYPDITDFMYLTIEDITDEFPSEISFCDISSKLLFEVNGLVLLVSAVLDDGFHSLEIYGVSEEALKLFLNQAKETYELFNMMMEFKKLNIVRNI